MKICDCHCQPCEADRHEICAFDCDGERLKEYKEEHKDWFEEDND